MPKFEIKLVRINVVAYACLCIVFEIVFFFLCKRKVNEENTKKNMFSFQLLLYFFLFEKHRKC